MANKSNSLNKNKIINGETVAYTITTVFSVFLLFAVKQLCKIIFSLSAPISVTSGFIVAELVSYLLERKIVFTGDTLSSNVKQIVFFIFRAFVDYGFYLLSKFIFTTTLDMNESFSWVVAISIVFFFNYFFDRLLVFDCMYRAEKVKKTRIFRFYRKYRFVIYAPVITLLGLGFIFALSRVFPFADSTIMRMDLYHQYGPLFAELYDRVINHQSFIYSWNTGGGSSFLGNYFNYLSSPLTALIFLFDKEDISIAITFLVAVKCLLSSATFSFYIKESQKLNNVYASLFGVMYAMSAYFLAYYWNVMWLDGMILFPIIILGIEILVDKNKPLTYIISLSILLCSSYYMGFMTCIFSVVYFFAYYLLSSKSHELINDKLTFEKEYSFKALKNRKFFNRCFSFGLSSIVAGALCAFVLIPVFIILRSSSATSDSFPNTFESYFKLFDFMTSHLANLETTIRSSGDDVLPNIYSGILAIILVPLFVINKKIRVKEKTVYILLILFLLFSFDNNCLNFIWHAFHFPNDLPFRFSYMYSFVILVIGARSIKKIDAIEIRDIGLVGMAWVFFILLAQKMSTTKMAETTIYFSIAFVIIWTAFLYIVKNNKFDKLLVSVLALALIFCEVIVCDTTSLRITQSNSDYKENFSTYSSAIHKIHSNDDDFYREELCYLERRMDPSYYGYNGMSTFSSMAYEDYSGLQYTLGMFGNRINSYTYNPQTPVYNMMFNIKYLMYLDAGSQPETSLYTLVDKSDDEKCEVYKNDYYLPIAFCVNNKLNDWITEEGNPFDVQNDFFRLSTGFENVFVPVEFTNTDYDSMSGDDVNENGTYWFTKDNGENSYGYTTITFKTTRDGNAYIYVSSPEITELTFNSENHEPMTQQIDEPYILDLGYYKSGEEIEMSIDFSSLDIEETNAQIYAYSCDHKFLDSGYEKLNSSALKVTSHNDTTIEGNINATENCWLYTSIPYDESWSLYVDGEKTETFKIGNTMIGAAIKKGEHNIKFKFTPRGMKYGIAISSAALVCLAGYIIFDKKRQKIKTTDNSITTSD